MPDDFQRLLAKSRRRDEPQTPSMFLIGHLQDVCAAADRVVDSTGEDQLRALGLEPTKYMARFRRCVRLAAAIHDIGKANDHFQGMLTGERDIRQNPQGIRHEWATILMIQPLKSWLLPVVSGSDTDFAIVEWAVAGHHPATSHESPPSNCPSGAGVEIRFLLGRPDGAAILRWLASSFKGEISQEIPPVDIVTRSLAESYNVFAEIGKLWRRAQQRWEEQVLKTEDRKLVAAVKDCLIAADIAGSALPKAKPGDEGRWNWITESFSSTPKAGDLEAIHRVKLGDKSPRQFQQQVAESPSAVTFVKAGCGTGKTMAAYMWAARNHPTRRLYFCYPTTGTATEGFKDYLFEPDGQLGELGARLFHSRRDVDFEVILSTGGDSEQADREAMTGLESLEAWSTPIVSCTVDTVLGLIQNNKRGLFGWPALAQSAFVFDEIHSYDDRLFGALLRFLIDLPGLPVLLMTASLPRVREDAIRTALIRRNVILAPISGPKELEGLPRYHKMIADGNDPLAAIGREIKNGGKVLWVNNTVGRVMDAARRSSELGLEPFIYHSRFKYIDRVDRHKDVVQAFTVDHQEPALAICSQVAEMSLDLKGCTLLVTDFAPVSAMIQRLGRLNRQAKPGDPTRPFVIIEPDNPAPYTSEELEAARQWVSRLSDTEISQSELAVKWEQQSDTPVELVPSAWLDGGPITKVTELREMSPGISVLMREDVDHMQTSAGKDNKAARYVLSMPPPKGMTWQTWSRYKGIPIAEPGFISYDRKRGAEWQLQRNTSPRII